MIKFYFNDGTEQVLNPSPVFFLPAKKGEPTVNDKCLGIMNDIGATSFVIA